MALGTCLGPKQKFVAGEHDSTGGGGQEAMTSVLWHVLSSTGDFEDGPEHNRQEHRLLNIPQQTPGDSDHHRQVKTPVL